MLLLVEPAAAAGQGARSSAVGAVAADNGRGALALAVLGMGRAQRQRVVVALAELGRRLDVRAHPLADDLEDEPPDACLRRLSPTLLPALTAAQALLTPAWPGAGGGDLVVRTVAICPAAARCVDPWARGETKRRGGRASQLGR